MVHNSAIIVLSNPHIAEKLKADLNILGISDIAIIPSIDRIPLAQNYHSPNLIILEFIDKNQQWLASAKETIKNSYGSTKPILLYTEESTARLSIKSGVLSVYGYITQSYSLRELELCLNALTAQTSSSSLNQAVFDLTGHQVLFNILPNGIIICNSDGQILNANHAICETLGYELNELLGRHIREIVPEDKQGIVDSNIERVLLGETINSEVINICKDGSTKYLNLIETKITLSSGDAGFIVVSIDITQKKETDELILESAEKYRVLVEKSNDGIIFAQNGKLAYGNPKIIEMTGITPQKFIGQPIESFLHSDEISKIAERYTKRLAGEIVPEIYETLIQHVDGRLFPVELNVNMATYRGHNTTIVFVRDISARKLAEKYLKESEESYRSVFDNSSEAIYIQDSKGVFLDVNKAAINLYGYSKSEIIGSTLEKLSASGRNDLNQIQKRFDGAFEGKTQLFEFLGKTKNGRIFAQEVCLNKGRYFGRDVVFAMTHDISERKNAEEVLIESEEKYRTLAEQIPVGLYRITIDGRFLYANLALAKILGYDSVAELMQHNTNEFYPEGNLLPKYIQEKIEQGIHFSDEIPLINKDKKVIWVRNNGQVKHGLARLILYIDGVIENITEQREASEALRKSEANLRAMLYAIPDLLFIINSNGVYKGFLSEHNDKQKTSPDKIVGYRLEDFFPIDISEIIHSSIKKCLSTYELQTIEYQIVTNGELQYYEARLVNANQDEVLCLARNITERKRSEDRIIMLAQTIMNVQECVTISDVNENFIFVNPAFTKTYGYAESEIIGKHISMVRDSSMTVEFSKEIYNSTLNGGWLGETKNIRKDGSEFPISLSTAVVKDDKGQPIAFVSVANDITDRKNFEQEMIAAKEKAEESDRLKTAFLANMSHEIRSPMNAILGFIRILNDEEKLSENGKQYVELIENSGIQLMSVIEDIIDTSKIQSNQLRLSIHEFDLNNLLFEIFNIFSSQVRDKSQMNTILLPPILAYPSPFLVCSDDLRIRQIITNLLSNASKFTPKGVIEFGYSLVVDDENPSIQIFVRDTGIGLASDKLELIFERFRQADDSYTRMYGGSGLGLAISKGLIEMLGGTIWVESKEGKGSTFYFSLPYKNILEAKKAEVIDNPSAKDTMISRINGLNWSGKTIFVIEDIKDIQFYLKKLLSRTGANLIFASNLKEARQVFNNTRKIDLILLDIRLPDGDGYELSREFKMIKPEIPIIAQTAYAMLGEKEKSELFGCDDYITKPIDSDLLFYKIINLFQIEK